MVRLLTSLFVFLLVLSTFAQGFDGPPAPPEGLSVRAGLYGGAALHWDSTSGALAYRIYKAVDGSPFWKIADLLHREFLDWYVVPGHSFDYYVTALNLNGESTPSATVRFRFDDHPHRPGQGMIQGFITDDSTGLPLREAVVQFFSHGGMWTEKTHTDSAGFYWASLDSGNYLLRAERFGYIGEWFDNVLRVENATIVPIHNDTVTANFGLRHLPPPPPPVNVTGRVTDSSTGTGLANAYVAFIRPPRLLRELEHETGLFGGFLEERLSIPELGELHGVVWVGRTDLSGNYSARLLGGLRYIAVAFKPGFVPKFYLDKYTPLDADRLFLTHDTTGIDFALVPNPIATNTLSGTVVDSTGAGVPSHVILLRRTPFGRLPVRFRMTDSLGNFEFGHLVGGNVYLKAIPVSGFAPAWYSATACGVSRWRNADSIHLAGDVTGINVCVVPARHAGFARIDGSIEHGSGGTTAPSARGSFTPAQGATVYAVSTLDNQVAGYDVTEEDGSYSLDNIPAGSYQIVVDQEGFDQGAAPTTTVDAANNFLVSSLGIVLTPEAVTGVKQTGPLPSEFRLQQNFPNPFNPSTQIRFDLPKAGLVNLRVYNLLGQEVALLTQTSYAAGSHTVQWNGLDGSGMPAGSGIYFFKIVVNATDGGFYTEVRKMMLVK